MKKIILTFFGIASLFLFAIFFQSCKDACKDVVCLNCGVCIDGVCIDDCEDVVCLNGADCCMGICVCTEGYEGSDCSIESRIKFLGNWNYLNACYAKTNETIISINNQGAEKVNITNILSSNLGGIAYAIVDSAKISIPSQTVFDNDNNPWTVHGQTTGNIDNNTFTISLKYTYQTQSETCLLTFTKQ